MILPMKPLSLVPAVLPALILSASLCAPAVRAADASPDSFDVGGLKFKRPTDWAWVPLQSSMRKAQLTVPGLGAGKNAEITFFHFGPSGGGDLESNIQRWIRQFQSAPGAEKVESKALGGRKTTIVTTEGTFSAGMPGQSAVPMENYALLGAIVEDPEGNVFVKMTGPRETVQAAKPKFLEFLEAAKH
jgi:hypothetical protein